MKWFKRILIALAAVIGVPAVALAVLAGAIALGPDPVVEARTADSAISGIFHVHTVASHDGYGSLAEAARAAREAGARFLVVTEHNVIESGLPPIIDGVVIVPGVELSAQAGHVIAIGTGGDVPAKEERGEGVLEAIAARGGDAILAHPVNRRRPWADPSTDGFIGFEALSLDSAFRTAQKEAPWKLALALAALLGDPPKTGAILMTRPAQALARYDEIAATRDVTLLCGVDAHGLPPYAASFGALRLHLIGVRGWGNDPGEDAAAVREAIREGRTFCSVPALGDASTFYFQGPGMERPGAVPPHGPQVGAVMHTPGTTVVLFHNGVEVARGKRSAVVRARPGVWRAEVWIDDPGFPFEKNALWIASSAIRIP